MCPEKLLVLRVGVFVISTQPQYDVCTARLLGTPVQDQRRFKVRACVFVGGVMFFGFYYGADFSFFLGGVMFFGLYYGIEDDADVMIYDRA